MKKIDMILVASAAALSLVLTGPALAQMTMDHGKMGMDQGKMGMDQGKMPMAAAPSMTDGEIRKIDKENGKVTIKHAEIKSLDMPGMTMVFTAKEKSLLDKIQTGDKVKFAVINDGGKMVVTDIQTVK